MVTSQNPHAHSLVPTQKNLALKNPSHHKISMYTLYLHTYTEQKNNNFRFMMTTVLIATGHVHMI